MFMFTAGQVKRMNATLAGPRALLSESMGLTPVSTPALAPEAIALAAPFARSILGDERGERPNREFDGIAWV
ncbi:hypothetical protein ACFX5Q_32865 [Mesorhizobium sp. IMUNJ 23033]|uniref:hypothetical protein n=1 Tax=Mesorhizobium sp. IMUNJ 23033 TaxID=3378039 RepID=UPI00384C497B